MKTLIAIVIFSLAPLTLTFAQSCDSLESLEWLLGEWSTEGEKSITTESWTRVSSKTFEGRGVTRSKPGPEIISSESLRLVEMSGEVFFWAKVSHNELPVAFKLTSCPGEEAVFENANHDFPKKLEYRLSGPEELTVVVSDGQEKGFALVFSRPATSGGENAGQPTHSWTGELEVHGALRAMFHEDQTGAMVSLDSLLPNPHLYAVGALADLAGEITVMGGEVYLSYPGSSGEGKTVVSLEADAAATLLVAAEVSEWREAKTSEPILWADLDEAVGELATSLGMDPEGRFPFLVEGVMEELQWHVIDGSRLHGGGGSHLDHLAASTQGKLAHGMATLVGFYSATDQGVFTHMGSRTHIHAVIPEPLGSGHVDHVLIPAGAVLKFPVR